MGETSTSAAAASAPVREADGIPFAIPINASDRVREAVGLPFGVAVEEASISALPHQWDDFKRSRLPKKIVLFGDKGKGSVNQDFPIGQGDLIGQVATKSFETRNPVAEMVSLNPNLKGCKLLFDFLRKVAVCVDAQGVIVDRRGFCWVDEDGWIFSSSMWSEADEDSVRKAFDGANDGRFAITAVRRCHHQESRIYGFLDKMKVQCVWVYGWYGGAADHVLQAASGGDLTANWQRLGATRAYGRGIHLSAQGKPMPSADISVLSQNDPQTAHLLYCALAPGIEEIVPAGSSQSGPISSIFGSGIDDTKQPTWRVFWESSVGTQVLPFYIISFRPTGSNKRPAGSPAPHGKASSQKKVRFNV